MKNLSKPNPMDIEKLQAEDLAFFKKESVAIRKNLVNMLTELSTETKQNLESMHTESGATEIIELASMESSRLLNLRFRDRDRKLIEKIYKALRRLNDQKYHLCENCEELIGRTRLMAKPTASLCVRCQQSVEQEKFVRQI